MARTNNAGVVFISSLEREVLSVLSRQGEMISMYGLEVIRHMNSVRSKYALNGVTIGSFYPISRRLELQGLVKCEWGCNATGGARRLYLSITQKGQEALNLVENYYQDLKNI